MIYVDTSVVVAQLLSEDVRPPAGLWDEPLVSSRLLVYETWTRINAMRLERSHGTATRQLLDGISLLELSPIVLERALEPFPLSVRTLDALHLASIDHLRARALDVKLASFDGRMLGVARRMRVPIEDLSV